MSRPPAPPAGFRVDVEGRAALVAKSDLIEPLKRAGLNRPEGWRRWLDDPSERPGRGATGVVELPGGPRVRIKQLRRGGWTARLWRDRFPGNGRLLDNLRVPVEAAIRGVSTPLPLALLLLEGPRGLYRGWLGLAEVEGASDLASRVRGGPPPTAAEWGAALGAVRTMHDAGVEHRDLNLGNLLVQPVDGGAPTAWVIDLDRARVRSTSIPFDGRQAALRRLERSYVKICGESPGDEGIRDGLYTHYAAGDRRLASRLARGRRVGRGWIRLHRLGWRR